MKSIFFCRKMFIYLFYSVETCLSTDWKSPTCLAMFLRIHCRTCRSQLWQCAVRPYPTTLIHTCLIWSSLKFSEEITNYYYKEPFICHCEEELKSNAPRWFGEGTSKTLILSTTESGDLQFFLTSFFYQMQIDFTMSGQSFLCHLTHWQLIR